MKNQQDQNAGNRRVTRFLRSSTIWAVEVVKVSRYQNEITGISYHVTWLSVWMQMWPAYGQDDATSIPPSFASVKSRMVYSSGTGLPGMSWEKAVKWMLLLWCGRSRSTGHMDKVTQLMAACGQRLGCVPKYKAGESWKKVEQERRNWERCSIIWSTWCHCHPTIFCFRKSQNALSFWYHPTRDVLGKDS